MSFGRNLGQRNRYSQDGRRGSEIRHGPVDRSHQKSSEVDPATSSAIVQDKGTAKCKFIESTGVHHAHPLLDMRGPLIVRAQGYCLVFLATFASDIHWIPVDIPFIVAVKCPKKCRVLSTVTQAAQ